MYRDLERYIQGHMAFIVGVMKSYENGRNDEINKIWLPRLRNIFGITKMYYNDNYLFIEIKAKGVYILAHKWYISSHVYYFDVKVFG